MCMKKGVVITILAIILLAVGFYVLKSYNTTTQTIYPIDNIAPVKKPARKPAQPAAPETSKTTKPKNTDNGHEVKLSGKYSEYNQTVLNQRLSEGKKVVLFFHAAWCPTCRSADKNIRSSIDSIPPDVALLKVNYDKEKALKNKYGVSYQHTFIQLAKDTSAVTKFQGSRTVPAILANLR